MVLIEGLTEVRPVNAIPPAAGFLFGPIGAVACGLGNLCADLFGSFGPSSVLGVAANFIAAFLPYRLWHLFSGEAPNLHNKKNIFLYMAICLVNAFTTAWFLSFGLYTFFNLWIEQVYLYVFFNNFGFALLFGMPLMIVMTSDFVMLKSAEPIKYIIFGRAARFKKLICAAYLLIMLIIFICVFFLHLSPQSASWMHILSALSLLGLLCQLI
jgi:energy-coupling factor transport system substrate-specific component